MPDPTTPAERHYHVVTLAEDHYVYDRCDECGGRLPFVFDLDWTTEELVRAAREHDVRIHFSFIPIEDPEVPGA